MGTQGKPFPKGNPGRPKGARDKATSAVEKLLEGESEAIGRKCVEMALGGDTTALRLAMERIAMERILPDDALGCASRCRPSRQWPTCRRLWLAYSRRFPGGRLSPEEGSAIGSAISLQSRVLELAEMERRIAALEQSKGGGR